MSVDASESPSNAALWGGRATLLILGAAYIVVHELKPGEGIKSLTLAAAGALVVLLHVPIIRWVWPRLSSGGQATAQLMLMLVRLAFSVWVIWFLYSVPMR